MRLSRLALAILILSTAGHPQPSLEPVAVLELFTSEGCSSCPPADELLSRLSESPGVIGLSFHVDYWNRLGWPDPFSRPEWTARQRAYATKLKERSLYTPQLIVNGSESFVGHDDSRARAALARAGPLPVTVGLEAVRSGDRVRVTYAADGGDLLNLALVESQVAVDVPRGENAGRRLRHVNVVRDFRTAPSGRGTAALTVPFDPRGRLEVVGYVQEAATWKVLGAARYRLKEP